MLFCSYWWSLPILRQWSSRALGPSRAKNPPAWGGVLRGALNSGPQSSQGASTIWNLMKSVEIDSWSRSLPNRGQYCWSFFFFLHACIEKSWTAGNWWGMCYVLMQYAEIPFVRFCIELVSTVALWRQMHSKNKCLHRAHPPLQIKFSANTELLLNKQAGMTFCCTRWHRRRVCVSFLWIG